MKKPTWGNPFPLPSPGSTSVKHLSGLPFPCFRHVLPSVPQGCPCPGMGGQRATVPQGCLYPSVGWLRSLRVVPAPAGVPQLCPCLAWSTSFQVCLQLCPKQCLLPQVFCIFQGVASPLQLPLSEMRLSWGAVGSPGCLWTHFYIKTGVGAAESATETDRYLTECYHGAYDFAATTIIIEVSFQLSATTAFPRHKGKGLCWGQENNMQFTGMSVKGFGRNRRANSSPGELDFNASWSSILLAQTGIFLMNLSGFIVGAQDARLVSLLSAAAQVRKKVTWQDSACFRPALHPFAAGW